MLQIENNVTQSQPNLPAQLIEELAKQIGGDITFEQQQTAWRADPVLYANEQLKLGVSDAQAEILYSIRDNRRTAVKAHHSLGKTFIVAVALLWWIDSWAAHIGYITAPTWYQALSLTFKQAKRLAMLNRLDFEILDTGWIRDRDNYKQTERYIKALNSKTGEGFQGEHTAPILIVKEEAGGIPSYIDDAAEGLMTNEDCRIIEIGNPTDEATSFGDHCESPNYNTLSYSALDHPNIQAELRCKPVPFDGAISLIWLNEMLQECDVVDELTEDGFQFYTREVIKEAINGKPVTNKSKTSFYKPNAFFQGRCLGEFPTEASDKVIPKGWLKNLPVREINTQHKIQVGCDVARFGDDRTTIFARVGPIIFLGKELRKFDTVAVADAIKDVINDCIAVLHKKFPKIQFKAKEIEVAIDITGGLGTGPYDTLKSEKYSVVGVNSSARAKDPELYKNKRSELWFDLQGRAKDKRLDFSRLASDLRKRLKKELSMPSYKVQSGKKVVEDKSEIKKRLGASPDLADGFNLAFYETGTVSLTGIKIESISKESIFDAFDV